MKKLLILLFICFSFTLSAQNASFGIGIGALNLERSSGLSFTGNVRTQFTNVIGWQTEVGYIALDEKTTIIEEIEISEFGITETSTIIEERGTNAMTFKTGVSVKFFELGGFRGEAIIGGGMYKENGDKIFGLLSGELFLSAQIGKNLVAGIPLSYNFITWERDEFYGAGISLRFHM